MRPLNKKSELKRLYDLGFGVHLLRPHSKVPVKGKWTTGERENIKTVLGEYQIGQNIGTRLGKASKIGKNYLALLDVDIKSESKAHRKAAIDWINKNFPGLYDSAPITQSGRGNGSMHMWVLVNEPMSSKTLYTSPDEVVVLMPSVKHTPRQLEVLGAEKVKEGYRLRPAFEIDFMCEGKQVVLPPSLHPDTGNTYKWMRPIENTDSIPLVDITMMIEALPENKKQKAGRPFDSTKDKLEVVDVDEYELEMRLSPEIVAGICDGEGVEDRSAYIFTIANAMVRARFSTAEILGVLTNRDYFIGECSYEHAKTTNRDRAALWAFRFTVHKSKTQNDASEIYSSDVVVYDTLNDSDREKQVRLLTETREDKIERDWKSLLDRTAKGDLKATFKNVKLILENDIAKDIFIRDIFAFREFYGCNTPWGKQKGEELGNDETAHILDWFSKSWGIEPNDNNIKKAITKICSSNTVHPVRDYLSSLEWDGTPRINTWLKDYVGAEGDDLYLEEVSRKFLVAAVARVFEPGRKYEYMLILEGKQGVGKSSVGNILAGGNWFLDSLPNLADKDAALNLQGNWIVEMGELSNLRRADVEVAKDFIARQVDKVRPPYGERYITSPRQCVFFGTTNSEDYLKDKTGNRRYWPVKVHNLDFEALKHDRDQLWAEAAYVYNLVNENLYLEGEIKEIAEEVQASRVGEDESTVIRDILADWATALKKARKLKEKETGKKLPSLRFRLKELFNDFAFTENSTSPLKDFKPDNYRLQMAAAALRSLGFKKTMVQGYSFWRILVD